MKGTYLLLGAFLFQALYLTAADPSGVCPSVNGLAETFLEDNEDCSVFYKCQSGVAYKYDCPGGLYFDSIIHVCVYPEQTSCRNGANNGDESNENIDVSVEESNENNSSDDVESNVEDGSWVGECPEVDGEFVTLLPHSSDCAKFFICNEGTPVLASCPGNLLFNPNLLVCDYPEDAGCGEGSNNGDSNESNDGGVVDGSEENNNDNSVEDGTWVGECPEVDGEFVTLLPHSSNCAKFFICNEGTPVLASCPGNLLFNPNLLVCDYPEDAGCGKDSNNENNNETDDGSVVEENNDNDNSENNVEDGSWVGECPEVDGEFVTLLPHSSDCSKFFICNEGTPVLTSCPGNLLFNPNLLVCDYPEDAGCGEGSNNGDSNESNDGGVVDGSEENNNDNSVEDGTWVGECPEVDGEFVTLLPHSSNCAKFFICNEGTPVLASCPGNLLFNPNLLVCDYPEDAGCGKDSNNENNNEIDDGSVVEENSDSDNSENNVEDGSWVGECPEVDGEFVTLLPHSSDCSKFFICNEGTPVLTSCPGNLLFNPNLLVCDYPEDAGCGESSNNGDSNESNDGGVVDESEENNNDNSVEDGTWVGECPEVDGEFVTLLPHSSDCAKFFICNEGTPVLASCPGNLLFNPNLLVCDYPEDAGCGKVSNSEDSNEVDNNNNIENNVEEGSWVGECPEEDGEFVTILPHASDCTKFFICSEGTPHVWECPPGLLFNPILLVCDYPESAGCGEGSNNGDSNETDDNGVVDGSEEDTNDNSVGDGTWVGECPEVDGEFVTLLPHSSDCTKFFICNEGTPVLAECPGNLLFNPNLLVCDYPENAGCGKVSNNEDVNEVDNNIVEGSSAVGECPEVDGEFVTILPHASDCTKFFVCSEGTPFEWTCPFDLHFNPILLVCDYPQSAGCVAENGGSAENGESSEIDEDNSDEVIDNSEDGTAVGECPEVDGEFVTLLPHSSDCTKFFICNEGTPVLAECPGNLLFNPNLLVCDYPENAGCQS